MNAMKRIKKESKRAREDDELTSEIIMRTVNFTLKSVALSLYELHGFHNKRTGRILQDACDRISKYSNKYGEEYVESAMDVFLHNYSLDITLRGE